MNKAKCLFCYMPLEENQKDYHPKCSKKMFGFEEAPLLEYSNDQMLELAQKIIHSHTAVTGVQPKLSLGLATRSRNEIKKFTIMGVMGNYILKPPSVHYNLLPELEDLTMHLAEISGIKTVSHTLIKLKSGELSYLTKRIDRQKKGKLHMEDMCQLTERLTEAKYKGSYEQIGKAIVKYSTNPGLDIINFFEQVLFSFLTGNSDMHLKNFSLLKDQKLGYVLSPAYDMVASSLVVPGDDEDLALTLNGKKKKIKKEDFIAAMNTFKIDSRVYENIFIRYSKNIMKWYAFIDKSFLDHEMKEEYKNLITERSKRLGLI
jgi:serine/threonine-protein kinase HipA